jgi:hypothetical protein
MTQIHTQLRLDGVTRHRLAFWVGESNAKTLQPGPEHALHAR